MAHEDFGLGQKNAPTRAEELLILKNRLANTTDPDALKATLGEVSRLEEIEEVIKKAEILLQDENKYEGLTALFSDLRRELKILRETSCSTDAVKKGIDRVREALPAI